MYIFVYISENPKSTALRIWITVRVRKKGEKTVAPRGPTPSYLRDVGGNQGKFFSKYFCQNITYVLEKYVI